MGAARRLLASSISEGTLRVGPKTVDCEHLARSGPGWLRCPCGAKCIRDNRGVIVRYVAFGPIEDGEGK